MPRTTGLIGLLEHLVIRNPIAQLENLVEEVVVRKVKFLYMKGCAKQ